MGFCNKRYIFLTICILQIIAVVERQVFDFLGFLWIPIFVNFFEIIFIIFGFFGAYQYRPNYIILYLLWHIFWLSWNTFIICLYLNIGGLDHEVNKVLKLDPTSDSWWKKEGPGCKIVNVDEIPLKYEGCYVDYVYIEVFQAGLQCFLALISCITGICLTRTFLEEDDTFNFEKADGPDNYLLHPMYVSTDDNLHYKHLYSRSRQSVCNIPNSGSTNKKAIKNVHSDMIRPPMRQNESFNLPHSYHSRPNSYC